MRITTYFPFLILCFLACTNNAVVEKPEQKTTEFKTDLVVGETFTEISEKGMELSFARTQWRAKDDHHYPHRNKMLANLIEDHTLDRMPKDEILDLLGEPDRIDKSYLFYTIAQKRIGFWPEHTKTLVIRLETDTINWIRIHE